MENKTVGFELFKGGSIRVVSFVSSDYLVLLVCIRAAEGEGKEIKFRHTAPYIYGIPLKDAKLEKEFQFDLPLLEKLFHLTLGLIELLQHALDVCHGAVVGCLVAGDGRVSANTSPVKTKTSDVSKCCFFQFTVGILFNNRRKKKHN